MKSKKTYIFSVCITAFICVAIFISFFTEPVASGEADEDKFVCYLENFGWQAGKEPIEISFEQIPDNFDDVWNGFNEIQLRQGFDLSLYRGKLVEKRVYRIYNYNNTDDKSVRADIFVYENNIIGADIFSVAVDGFMHGVNEFTDGKNTDG